MPDDERNAATDYAESKCNMCHGEPNLDLEHICSRIKDGYLTGFEAGRARSSALDQLTISSLTNRIRQLEDSFAAERLNALNATNKALETENARFRELLEACCERLDDSDPSDSLWCDVNEALKRD